MTIERREFLKLLGAGTVIAALPAAAPREDLSADKQEIHQDYQSNTPGTEYFFLGNGLIMAALQTSPDEAAGTHCGLLLMSPEHFGRKSNTYLFHPERGLRNTRFIAIIDGTAYTAEFTKSQVRREYPGSVPTVVIEWTAGELKIREELMCPAGDPAIVRTVTLENTGTRALDVTGRLYLYPNLGYFDEYHVDYENPTLTAKGYQTLELFSTGTGTAGDRFLNTSLGKILPDEKKSATFILTLNYPRREFESKGLPQMMEETRNYWSSKASFNFNDQALNHLLLASMAGIRSAVAISGKMDGSIWQYNMEWVRDQSMVAAAAAMTGQTEISAAILKRILTHSVNKDGKTVDASRHRTPETIELDQNGELLHAIHAYWVWSGDDSIVKLFWDKIKNVADYVLQPPFLDIESGLLKNTREYWERDASMGVKEGFELVYQAWNISGLEKASRIARHMNENQLAEKWLKASQLMKQSFTHHAKLSLVDGDRFIKRRLTNGEVQRTLEPPNRKAMPPGMPLSTEKACFCDPDSASTLPITLEIVDPTGPLAKKTLESIEELWNQRWDTGGYARYNVSSEPDSPGPWPLATMLIARAYHEAGDHDKVRRSIEWISNVQGGKAGSWLEFFGHRPVPPLPPVGILAWTWAEIITFFMHHVVGIRPSDDKLIIRPKLLAGMKFIEGDSIVRGRKLHIIVRTDPDNQFARIDGGEQSPLKNGAIELEFPKKDIQLEIHTA